MAAGKAAGGRRRVVERADFYKGLIQLAVAYYQYYVRRRRTGAGRLFARVRRLLAPFAPEHRGVDVRRLLHDVEVCIDAVAAGEDPPKLTLRGPGIDPVVEGLKHRSKRAGYPEHPRPSVHAAIVRDNHALLVLRKGEPFAGRWGLPGGALELGETLETALTREVREETGLEVRPVRVIDVRDAIHRDPDGRIRFHYLVLFMTAVPTGGRLRAADDAGEARWVSPEELRQLPLVPGVTAILARAGFPA